MRGLKLTLKLTVALLVIVGLVLPQAGWAEGKKDGVIKLEQIVVTATKTEKKLEDAPGSISVISSKELELCNIKTVDEALSELTGVFAKRNKRLMDSTSSVRLRGFSGDEYTLILLDGQPLNDAYTGGLEWGMLSVNNIERIEVIRGASSALYGGNAMGGVINIITKTPEKLEASATAGYGTHNTRRYRFSIGDRFADKFSLRIGYEEESTDGYETTPVVKTISTGAGTDSGGYAMDDKYGEPTKWVVGDKGENRAEKSSIDAKVTFDFSDTGSLAFTTVSGRHEYDYGPPNTYMGTFSGSAIAGTNQYASFSPNDFISYTGIGRNETDIYTLTFKELFGPVKLNVQGGTVITDDSYTTESGGSTKTYYDSPGFLKITENETLFFELSADVPLGESHLLTFGVSYRTDESDTDDYNVPFYRSYSGKGNSTFYSGGKDKIWAVFMQEEWSIAEPLTLYLGGRYDMWKVYDGASGVPGSETEYDRYDSNTESEFSPKASVVWKALPDTTLKASVGHAFRPPNLYELYRTWESWGTTYQSNPNLKPETVWTYEAGVDQYFFDKKTKLSLTGYQNDIEDLIYYKIDGATKTRTNAGKACTYGLEFEVSQQITDWLTAWGNYTWTQAEIVDNPTDPESENKRITGIPKTTCNIGIDAKHKWFKGSLVGRYFSKIFNDSDNQDKEKGVYQTYEPAFYMDGKITFSPSEWTDISLSVDNILNKEYWQYYEEDGRTFLFELTLKY